MNTTFTQTLGGWSFDNALLKGTGVAIGTFITLLAYPAVADTGTTGSSVPEVKQSYESLSPQLKIIPQESNDIHRTAAENLIKIRTVFKPAISDLANIFGVSRQAIYNWLSGEEPIAIHAEKIKDLASAADLVTAEGIVITGHILKRKITNGKPLFQLIQDGGSARNCILVLLEMLRRESGQRKQIEQRLANRPQPASNSMDIGSLVFKEIG